MQLQFSFFFFCLCSSSFDFSDLFMQLQFFCQNLFCTSILWKGMCKFKTRTASASSVSGSARSWPAFGQIDGSTAAGSHGPGSSDDHRQTRDKDLILLQAQEMNNHEVPFCSDFCVNKISKGVTQWIDTLWEESNMLACNKSTRINALQSRLRISQTCF